MGAKNYRRIKKFANFQFGNDSFCFQRFSPSSHQVDELSHKYQRQNKMLQVEADRKSFTKDEHWTEFWLNGAISSDVGKGRTVQTTTMVGQVEPAMCFANTLSLQWLSPFCSDIYHCLHCTPVIIVAIKKSSFCNHRIAHYPFGDTICSSPKDGWAKDQDLEKEADGLFSTSWCQPQ